MNGRECSRVHIKYEWKRSVPESKSKTVKDKCTAKNEIGRIKETNGVVILSSPSQFDTLDMVLVLWHNLAQAKKVQRVHLAELDLGAHFPSSRERETWVSLRFHRPYILVVSFDLRVDAGKDSEGGCSSCLVHLLPSRCVSGYRHLTVAFVRGKRHGFPWMPRCNFVSSCCLEQYRDEHG